MDSELKLQESIYQDAHTRLLEAHNQFDEEVKGLYQVCACYNVYLFSDVYSVCIQCIKSIVDKTYPVTESPRQGDGES